MTTPRIALIGSRILPAQAALFNYVCNHYDLDLTLLLSSEVRTALVDGTEIESRNLRQRIFAGKPSKLLSALGINYDLNIDLVSKLISGKYDLYIIAGYHLFSTQMAFILSIIKSIPSILYVESHGKGKSLSKIAGFSKRIVLSFLVRSVSAYFAVSSWAKDYLINYGAIPQEIFVIPHLPAGPARPTPAETSEKEVLRQQNGIKSDVSTILWVGRMVDLKRLDTLLQALMIVQKDAQVQLVLVGSGPDEVNLRQQAEDLQLSNVYFVGSKNRRALQDYYRLADVLVLPSSSETFSAVIPEAMAQGLPIVTTNVVGASADFVVDGSNGFIIPPYDALALAAALTKIIKDKALREEMSRKSLEIMAHHSIEKNAEIFMDAIGYALRMNPKKT